MVFSAVARYCSARFDELRRSAVLARVVYEGWMERVRRRARCGGGAVKAGWFEAEPEIRRDWRRGRA